MTAKIKWLVALLALSLAANIFVAGHMLGKGFKSGPHMRGGTPGIEFNIKRFGQYLSKDERKKIRKILRGQRGALGQRYRMVKASENRIKGLIAAKLVDKDALLAALKSHSELMKEMHAPMQRVMMEVIAELDYETREKMAGEMFKRGKRGGRHGGPPPFIDPEGREDHRPRRGDGMGPPPPEDERDNEDSENQAEPEPTSL